MADKKISELSEVFDLLTTDELVLARSGATNKISGATLASEIQAGFVAGGMVLVHDETLVSAGTFDVSGISGSYKHLKIVLQGRCTGAVAGRFIQMRFNNDSGGNYDCAWVAVFGNSASNLVPINDNNATSMAHVVEIPGASGPSNASGQVEITVANYASTVFQKTASWNGGASLVNDANGMRADLGTGIWKSTAAITRVQLFPASSDTLVTGSRLSIYGLS